VAGNDDNAGNSDSGSNPSTEAIPTEATPTKTILEEINQQTGVIDWQELVKHFARGVVIRVDAGLDLVKVAHSMSLDDKAQMQQWLDAGTIRRASDDDARGWTRDNSQFWCVAVSPWVLVQEKGAAKDIH